MNESVDDTMTPTTVDDISSRIQNSQTPSDDGMSQLQMISMQHIKIENVGPPSD